VRDDLLTRWVHQPPAEPNVQYLRDAERLAAWEQLGPREHVLDVASEANVTAGLDAERVTRVDFSPGASERAETVLGGVVDRYERADPEAVSLPFEADTFDGAVSIGPFDWKFLDVDRLLDELHRVVDPAGRLVFSVPTPRSPYATDNWPTIRYYTPEEAEAVVSPDWRRVDRDLVFQYPYRIHRLLNDLPARYQEPFVDVGWRMNRLLTGCDLVDQASYLVYGVHPMAFEDRLEAALACLFRPTDEQGFWDPAAERFVRALRYERRPGGTGDGFAWTPTDDIEWRYAPFALMGAMQWRASAFGTDAHDAKLRRELTYFTERVADGTVETEMPSYGVGPLTEAFALAARTFDDRSHADTAERLFTVGADRFDFDHAEDSLLLYGWARLFEHRPSERLASAIDDALWAVVDRQTADGVFEFDNPTTRRHQNQMYTLWGLARAIEVTGRTNYLENVERTLAYAVDERMREDGAFLWKDVSRRQRFAHARRRGHDPDPPQWTLLFECHQTFFVNAVAHYEAASDGRRTRSFAPAVRRAMSWMYGGNEWERDLVAHSGIGVPMRFTTVDGRMDVAEQRFKGAYEVGSYLMALTNLLTRTAGSGGG
jgi:SAM-dependent methyltransferase